jgi:aryl-alcohol dehydrogenase-like predicted oxidoreductase
MKTRLVRDIEVSAVGFGCMGFSHGYGPAPDHDEAVRLIRYAVDLGCTHFDTAEGYGAGDNELLVGEALRPVRNEIAIATKFRFRGNESTSGEPIEKLIRAHLEASLNRLGIDHVELYYLHRIDPAVPVEDVAEPMGKLVREGRIRGWGLSQSTTDQIRRAHAITPLSAVQSEYSMMERMFEKDVLPLCQELNIGFVAFSPLASGFLSGKVQPGDTYVGDDVRRVITRFDPENVKANQPLVEMLQRFAEAKGATPAQVSLAWILAKWPIVTPIPGARKTERIEENLSAADVELSPGELDAIERELAKIPMHGNRTDEDIMKLRER